MDKSYFQELYEIYPAWKNRLTKRLVYDAYFDNREDLDLKDYFEVLITHAKGCPVIQECRTVNRIAAIKSMFSGCHIYLWRNPWDQWWSYKVNQYFNCVNLLILNADPHPEVIASLRREVGFEAYHSEDLIDEFAFFDRKRLPPEESYLVFYILWLLGIMEGRRHADLLINIDAMSDQPDYRQEVVENLECLGISGLDFNDCRVVQSCYGDQEKSFYHRIEERAYGLLLASGFQRDDLEAIQRLREKYHPLLWQRKPARTNISLILNNAERARETVLKAEAREAHHLKSLAEVQDRCQWLEAEWNAAREKTEALRGELEQCRAENEALDDALDKTHQALVDQQTALVREQDRSRWLEKEWNAAKQRIEELVTELGLAQSDNQRLRSQIELQNRELEQVHARFHHLEEELQIALARVDELAQSAHHWQYAAQEQEKQLKAMYASWSWKVTSPLRVLWDMGWGSFRLLQSGAKLSKPIILWPILAPMHAILQRPQRAERINRLLMRYSWLHVPLRTLAIRHGLMQVTPSPPSQYSPPAAQPDKSEVIPELPSHARWIYLVLQRTANHHCEAE
ncbi:MAG: hypothetical protein L3J63_05875 [Geopsychrobacter sp.]|nr:hypothetical protein [Geopsychrobacter sp.]